MLDSTYNTLDDPCFEKSVKFLDKKLVKFSNVKIIETGNIFEVFYYEFPYSYNFGAYRRNAVLLERDTLINDRRDAITRAQSKIRRLVNANAFVYGCMPIFVTYTFKQNLQDITIANKLFTAHIRSMKKKHFGKLRYLAVPELQKRGAIHYHVVFFDLPFIDGIKRIFENQWAHGFLQVKAIKHVRNIGAYVSKYFAKQWYKSRLRGEKSYFTSFNLYQPKLHRGLDAIPALCTMKEELSQSYDSSKLGRVIYKQYKLIK